MLVAEGDLNVYGRPLGEWIGEQFDAQPERVALAEVEHLLAPKVCGKCGRDLAEAVRASDPGGEVNPGEYIEMVYITPEDLGRRAYECAECVNEPCGECQPDWVWPTNWPYPGCMGCPRIKEQEARRG
jgi:hypothetical protein